MAHETKTIESGENKTKQTNKQKKPPPSIFSVRALLSERLEPQLKMRARKDDRVAKHDDLCDKATRVV